MKHPGDLAPWRKILIGTVVASSAIAWGWAVIPALLRILTGE